MNSFLNSLNVTRTENGALALASSGSELVNLFGLGAAMRKRSAEDMKSLFASAYNEDKLLATKIAFYIRDVRGGQGERDAFRNICDWLAENDSNTLIKNLEKIPEFGRWDDLARLSLSNDEVVSALALTIVEKQLELDKEAEHPSLLAKWMPSENTSDKETIADARKMAKKLGLSRAQYRKELLSPIRAKIVLVESLMCAKEWDGVNYENVPSRAAMTYRNAFKKHDEARYNEYLGAVEKGEKVIKASTLYPYDLYNKVNATRAVDRTLEAQWKALPDFLKDNPDGKGIVVADTSASMNGDPIAVAVSLAIYMAERNVGPFQDAFITFSMKPQLHMLKGDTLYDKIRTLDKSGWDMNTDINAVFRLILDRGVAAKVSAEDMPSTIYIISDMQFDRCTNGNQTNFEAIREMYAKAGYVMPKLVFWNVRASGKQVPAAANENGVFLVSGCSPVIFEQVMKAKAVTPYELMLETLNKPRYDVITV